jgi:hypothetical protein
MATPRVLTAPASRFSFFSSRTWFVPLGVLAPSCYLLCLCPGSGGAAPKRAASQPLEMQVWVLISITGGGGRGVGLSTTTPAAPTTRRLDHALDCLHCAFVLSFGTLPATLPHATPAIDPHVQAAAPAALAAPASAPSSQSAAASPRVRPSAAHSHSHRLGSLGLQVPCLGLIAPLTVENAHASPARWLHRMLTLRGHAPPVQRDIGREPGLRALSTTRRS